MIPKVRLSNGDLAIFVAIITLTSIQYYSTNTNNIGMPVYCSLPQDDVLLAKTKQIKSLHAIERQTALTLAKGKEKVENLNRVVDTLQQCMQDHAHIAREKR